MAQNQIPSTLALILFEQMNVAGALPPLKATSPITHWRFANPKNSFNPLIGRPICFR
jgi:hypothetical protein